MIPRPVPLAIALASDHAGFDLKALLADWLRMQGHEVSDLGPRDTASVDYPDYGYRLADVIATGLADYGVAVCGSGIGISIAVNRNPAAMRPCVGQSVRAACADAQRCKRYCIRRTTYWSGYSQGRTLRFSIDALRG